MFRFLVCLRTPLFPFERDIVSEKIVRITWLTECRLCKSNLPLFGKQNTGCGQQNSQIRQIVENRAVVETRDLQETMKKIASRTALHVFKHEEESVELDTAHSLCDSDQGKFDSKMPFHDHGKEIVGETASSMPYHNHRHLAH